uniref:TFIIS-type domain-containing protein n=1 Tax=viral metagenome TaxID=1070528 RepID=A0A6C0LUH1_9ZZZZ
MTTIFEFNVSDKERKRCEKKLSTYFNVEEVVNVEKGIYDYTEQYCNSNGNYLPMSEAIYKDISKNLLFNCEQNHDTIRKLIRKINNGKYNGYNLAFLKPEELDVNNWIKIILRRKNTDDKLNNRPTIKWKKCRDCGSNDYFFYQLQTRSADEPMTTFYICKQCERTYRFNN